MVVSKHLTHFCYPIRLVLHQHLNSHVAYPGIPPENSKIRKLEGTMASADISLVCGLNFQVGCQDSLRLNSDADKALA